MVVQTSSAARSILVFSLTFVTACAAGTPADDAGEPTSDAGPPDLCADVTCDAPPEDVCADDATLLVFDEVPRCVDGECLYGTRELTCPAGCAMGACVAEPCGDGVCDMPPGACFETTGTCFEGECIYRPRPPSSACDDGDPCTEEDRCADGVCGGSRLRCDTPPADVCVDADTLRTHAVVGVCDAGSCTYAPSEVVCASGCVDGACMGDPCAGVTCASPPAPAVCWGSTGTCDDGSCEYTPLDGVGCDDGDDCTLRDTCAAGACAGEALRCDTPPPAECADDTTSRTFAASGACVAGSCDYTPSETPCATGQRCRAGVCGDAATSLAAGGGHACAIVGSGELRCWGRNSSGQLGDGTRVISRPAILRVPGLPAIAQVAAGEQHTLALATDGSLWAWGRGMEGELGDGGMMLRESPVSVTGISTVAGISAGSFHSCAWLTDGSARCWGDNTFGLLGDGTTMTRPTPTPVSGLTGVVEIAAGGLHSCARLSGGTLRCWGRNGSGELGDGTMTDRHTPVDVVGITNAVSVTVGASFSCAALADGSARCWGANTRGTLGDGTTTRAATPVVVSGLAGATTIRASQHHACALLGTGAVHCWGRNDQGQLGDGTTTDRLTAGPVTGVTSAVELTGPHSNHFDCARLADGTARCWGQNYYGQLGDGTTTDASTPVMVGL